MNHGKYLIKFQGISKFLPRFFNFIALSKDTTTKILIFLDHEMISLNCRNQPMNQIKTSLKLTGLILRSFEYFPIKFLVFENLYPTNVVQQEQ